MHQAILIVVDSPQGQQKSFEEFYRQFSRQSGLKELRYAVDLMQAEEAKKKVGDTFDANSASSNSSSVSPIQQAFIDAAILQNLEQVPQPKLTTALDDHIRSLPTARMIRQRLQWIGIFSAWRFYSVQFFGWNPAPTKLLGELRKAQSLSVHRISRQHHRRTRCRIHCQHWL